MVVNSKDYFNYFLNANDSHLDSYCPNANDSHLDLGGHARRAKVLFRWFFGFALRAKVRK
jgi:hypothetical protein